jgi:hypothetical protein
MSNRYYLESQIRSIGIAYILFFIVGGHYAYLNKWGYQILYWITLGGLGIWFLIDLFRVSEYVRRFNADIFYELDRLDYQEREIYDDDEDQLDHLELEKYKEKSEGRYLRDDDLVGY